MGVLRPTHVLHLAKVLPECVLQSQYVHRQFNAFQVVTGIQASDVFAPHTGDFHRGCRGSSP